MTITLPKDVLASLPAPDEEGLVRATVAMKVNPSDGTADIQQLNGKPVGTGDGDGADSETGSDQNDDSAPMPEAPPLDPSKMY
jgi:hypothetical protein